MKSGQETSMQGMKRGYGQAVWSAHTRQSTAQIKDGPPPSHSGMQKLVRDPEEKRRRRRSSSTQSALHLFLLRYVRSILTILMKPDTVTCSRRFTEDYQLSLCRILYPLTPLKKPIRPCFRDPSGSLAYFVYWVLLLSAIASTLEIIEYESVKKLSHLEMYERGRLREPLGLESGSLPSHRGSKLLFVCDFVGIGENLKLRTVRCMSSFQKGVSWSLSNFIFAGGLTAISQRFWVWVFWFQHNGGCITSNSHSAG